MAGRQSYRTALLSLSRNTAYNIFGAVIPIALSLATVPIYLKLIGPERYGVLAIAWLLLGYFGVFDLGLGRSTAFRMASLSKAPASARADTFWAAVSVNLLMGLLGGVLLWGAGSFFFGHLFKIDGEIKSEILASVPLIACAVPIATLTGVLTGALQGREEFLKVNIISILSTMLFQLAPIAVALSGRISLKDLLFAAILAKIASVIVLFIVCYRRFAQNNRIRLVKPELFALIRYGFWVNLTSLVGPFIFMMDRFSIGSILGPGAVTLYTVPLQLASRIQILPGAMTNALFPRLSSLGGGEQRDLGERASQVLAAFMSLPTLVAVYLFEPFLTLWLGADVAERSGPIGQIVVIGFWVNSLAQMSFIKLQASGRPKVVALAVIAELPIYNLALFLVLGKFGILGCAILFSVRCFIDYLLLSFLCDGKFVAWKSVVWMGSILSAAVYAASVWSAHDWQWWASSLTLALLLSVTSWVLLPQDVKVRVFKIARLSDIRARLQRAAGK